MDIKKPGNLIVKFSEGKIIQQELFKNCLKIYIKVSLGAQHFITSSIHFHERKLIWLDLMKFIKSSEETLKIECFGQYKTSPEVKLGSIIFPIQTVLDKSYFKDNLMLMSFGKVSLHIGIEMQFEEKSDILYEYTKVIYPIPPPEQPHVHAFNVPPNFIYTPPAYYSSQHTTDSFFN